MCKTIEITEKRCSKCGEVKPVEEFHRNRTKKYGLNCECKGCQKKYKDEYYTINKDNISKYQTKYYTENRDKVLKRTRKYRKKNRDRINENRREYYDQYKDRIIESNSKYKVTNWDKIKKNQAEYREKNREKISKMKLRWKQINPEKIRKYEKKSVENLSDWYIKGRIRKQFDLTAAEIDSLETDVISAKRKQIEIHRKMKQIKTT